MKWVKHLGFLTACSLAAVFATVGQVQAEAQERWVSIGGDVTEIIYALNAEQNLVGRDSTSILPEAAKSLPDVGYMRQLNAEGILSLKPTKVISSQVAQPSAVFEQLKAAGIQVERVPFDYSPESIVEKIQIVGKIVGKPEQAVKLAEQFTNALKQIDNSLLNVRVLFIFNHAGANQMVAGKNTVADTGIRFIGAKNAMENGVRFSPISQEGIVAAKPDLIVMTKSGIEALGSEEKVWTLPGVALTPAGKKHNLVVVDDLAFLAFSLTTPKALQKIRQAAEKVHNE